MVWIAFVLFLVAAGLFTVAAIYFRRAAPILRARVVETLSTRFDSRVELATFDVSVFHGFEVSGGGLKLYPRHLDMQQPLFSVDKFSFRTGWRDLLRTPMHIGQVQISGLGINMPPKEQRHDMPKLNQGGSGGGKIQILVDELLIDNATLILETSKPGKVPLDFEISKLRMTSVGAGQPMQFHAILTNPKPVGNIDSTGYFGPYNAHSPGDSPVRGKYSFSHADLGTFKGIGGILSSTGVYQGTLNNIVVDGETDTPDFRLSTANHQMPLHTKFYAIVDGTNGDTHLLPVDAMLAHSHIIASGDVVRAQGMPGHDITLDVTVAPARIDDMLRLGVKTEPPVMTGDLTMHTKFHLPPGQGTVLDRLHLKGNFEITNVHFTNDKIQGRVDELSLRGQGKPKEAKEAKEAKEENPDIASEMRGNFELGEQKITITDLDYRVPGAEVAMSGVYTLDGDTFNFHGVARMQAKVSEMVTGWKSWALKLADPLFMKHGAGTEVPIEVTGTRSEPHFGVEMDKVFGHKDKDKNNGAKDQGQTPAQTDPK
ncbi:MAG TPA: hypothetical protein VK819_08900 [Acidobacteriaceae bacterium]|nr:hypothetical protein [Acidobacteriaceae bacterium]